MTRCFRNPHFRSAARLLGRSSAGFALAQSTTGDAPTRPDREQLPQPVYKVAHKNAETSEVGLGRRAEPSTRWRRPCVMAEAAMANIKANVKDYTATLVKRERIDGKLNDPESMFVKVRQEPFSVYLYFVARTAERPGSAFMSPARTAATCWPTAWASRSWSAWCRSIRRAPWPWPASATRSPRSAW